MPMYKVTHKVALITQSTIHDSVKNFGIETTYTLHPLSLSKSLNRYKDFPPLPFSGKHIFLNLCASVY